MCDCITQVNEGLKERNVQLSLTIAMTMWKDDEGRNRSSLKAVPPIATENIVKSRKKPIGMLPSYCPFCGEKYDFEQSGGATDETAH